MKVRLSLIFFFVLFELCHSGNLSAQVNYVGKFKLAKNVEMPFRFQMIDQNLILINGSEKLPSDEFTKRNDSTIASLRYFDSELVWKVDADKKLKGYFINRSRADHNKIPFTAEIGSLPKNEINGEIGSTYSVTFDNENPESKNAIALLKNTGEMLTGTFLTTAGDYRFLEGRVSFGHLWLSGFDGSHVFYFTANFDGDSLKDGHYYSGTHWHDTWSGVKNDTAILPSAESFTKFDSTTEVSFSFPDENGKTISLADEKYKGKAIVLQIMGSWCPNCMDESRFISSWYSSKPDMIEVIGLDYERIADTGRINATIKKMKNNFQINYEIAYAGPTDRKYANKTIPQISGIFAFPTLIFLNKEHKIVAVHSGFSGPATGREFTKFIEYFDEKIKQLQ